MGFPALKRFVADDSNATNLPSPLIAFLELLLTLLAAPPFAATEIVVVEGEHPATAPLELTQLSRRYTMLPTPAG